MGHALMDKVVANWGGLPGNAFKVLMVMASTAHDDDAKPVYYGGWERIAIVGLGRRNWPADNDLSPGAVRSRYSHWEAVRASLENVRKAGAISVKVCGKPGSRAEYWVHVEAPDTGKPCIPVQEKPVDLQEKPVNPQENPAPKYPQSPQSSGEITTSSKSVTHQSARRVATEAKSNRLQLVRDRADAEATA